MNHTIVSNAFVWMFGPSNAYCGAKMLCALKR